MSCKYFAEIFVTKTEKKHLKSGLFFILQAGRFLKAPSKREIKTNPAFTEKETNRRRS